MKTLIVYSSNHGTSEKAANILKSKLAGEVHTINIMFRSVSSFQEYDNIIIGGSIYVGKTQKKLSAFVSSNESLLLKKRIGLFLCTIEQDSSLNENLLITAFSPVIFKHAIATDIFKFNIHKLNFFQKIIKNKIKGLKTSTYKLSEEKIYEFAKNMVKTNCL